MQLRRFRPGTAHLVAIVTATGLASFAACGGGGDDHLPDGPEGVFEPSDTTENGTMQSYMTDDPSSSSATAAARASAANYDGTMTGKADVEVSTNKKTWYTLGAPREFSVALQAEGEKVELSGSSAVPADTYRFVRINWNDVEANLSAGSQVGDQTLNSSVSLRLGDATTAVMSQEVDAFELEAGANAEIVVDLNSERWMKAEHITAREIPKTEFENEARIDIVSAN